MKRIYPDLPALIGQEAWEKISPEVNNKIATLASQPDSLLASIQLRRLFDDYIDAKTRLTNELAIQADVSQNIATHMADIATSLEIDPATIGGLIARAYIPFTWEADPNSISTSAQMDNRMITIDTGGIDGATSVKFKNMNLDWSRFSELSAGVITTSSGMMDKPHPLLIAAGILLTFAMIRREMTTNIAEQEASVFWAMIQLTEAGNTSITESDIIDKTNAERQRYGLAPLQEEQVRHSLTKLATLKSIEKTGNTYNIIEKYTIKD